MKKNDLRAKANELLQEFRIVLPGTEALLGFQFVTFFNAEFQSLPRTLQYIHFATLLLSMASTILLIAPVAFQQFGESGKVTERFISFSRNALRGAMLLLLLALTGNVYIATRIIRLDNALASAIAAATFAFGFTAWYVYVLFRGTNSEA